MANFPISELFLLAVASALAIGWYVDHGRLSKQLRAEAADPLCPPMKFSLRTMLIVLVVSPPLIAAVAYVCREQYQAYQLLQAIDRMAGR